MLTKFAFLRIVPCQHNITVDLKDITEIHQLTGVKKTNGAGFTYYMPIFKGVDEDAMYYMISDDNPLSSISSKNNLNLPTTVEAWYGTYPDMTVLYGSDGTILEITVSDVTYTLVKHKPEPLYHNVDTNELYTLKGLSDVK